MTLTEFRAWLEGYSDAIGDAPNAEQWQKIKQKLATVSDAAQLWPHLPLPTPRMSPDPWIAPPPWVPAVTCTSQVFSGTEVAEAYSALFAGAGDDMQHSSYKDRQ